MPKGIYIRTEEMFRRRAETRRKNCSGFWWKNPEEVKKTLSASQKKAEMISISCKFCKTSFLTRLLNRTKTKEVQYCSRKCADAGKICLKIVQIECKQRNKIVVTNNSNRQRQYCSMDCFILSGRLVSKTRFKSGEFYSKKNDKTFRFRSSWEEYLMIVLEYDNSIISYEYEPFAIDYVDENGKARKTIPDFVLHYADGAKEIIEIKPEVMIPKNFRKLTAMSDFAKQNNFSFNIFTERQLSGYAK